jgi:methionyl-tRNA formyltransferase
MNHPRVLFAGTPVFARASLEALLRAGIKPITVLTQPDRPAGRGKQLTASPVKECALEAGIPVMQPATLKDADVVAQLEALEPDIMIVAAYGLILPQNVLDIPTKGCLNVHASLLPAWRGAAPIQAAILAGDARTGISLMAMTAGLDCGPVYIDEAIEIGPDESAGELHDRLAELGGGLLAANLDAILEGRLEAVEQDESLASYAGKIRTADAKLDFSKPATDLERQVRAFNPVPGAWFMLDGERIKCWAASVIDSAESEAGTVLDAPGVVVACGERALSLERLQRPGKRPVSAAEFASAVEPHGKRLA